MVRKRYLEESFGDESVNGEDLPPSHLEEHITRKSLEDDAREGTLHSNGPQDHFWKRQQGWEESAKEGAMLIEKMAPAEEKKQQ